MVVCLFVLLCNVLLTFAMFDVPWRPESGARNDVTAEWPLFLLHCVVVGTYHMKNGKFTIAAFLCIYVEQYHVYD